MSPRDVKTAVVTTAFMGILVGAVAFALGGPWSVAGWLTVFGLWLFWDQARRERRAP